MGRLNQDQGQLFYSFCLEDVVPADHRVREIAAVLDLSWVHGSCALLLAARPPIDRSGAHDPDAYSRLCVRHPLGAAAVPRSAGEPGLSLVLRPQHRGQDPGSFGVLARSQRALPRQRYFPARVRAGGGGVYRGGPGRRRGVRGRCQPDCGGRQQAAVDPGHGLGQEAQPGDGEPGREGVSGNPRRCGLRRCQQT